MTPEGKVKAKIVARLKTFRAEGVPIFWFSPIGSVYGKSGVPDIVVCIKGRFVGIEVKAPGKINNTTPLQDAAHAAIRAAGGGCIVVDNAEAVASFLQRF